MVKKENNNTRAAASGDQARRENKGVKEGQKKLLLVFAQMKLSVVEAAAVHQVTVSITCSLVSAEQVCGPCRDISSIHHCPATTGRRRRRCRERRSPANGSG